SYGLRAPRRRPLADTTSKSSWRTRSATVPPLSMATRNGVTTAGRLRGAALQASGHAITVTPAALAAAPVTRPAGTGWAPGAGTSVVVAQPIAPRANRITASRLTRSGFMRVVPRNDSARQRAVVRVSELVTSERPR